MLYKKLIELQRSLSVLNPGKQNTENCSFLSEHITRTYGDQINEQFDGAIKSLHEATHDLLSLSLLVPSAPWVRLIKLYKT